MLLLSARTTDGSGSSVIVRHQNRGGTPVFTAMAFGTFDGATVTLEVSPDGTEWVSAYAFTSEEVKLIEGTFYAIRGTVSSAGASTSLSLTVD
jgi:hypothetical protein